MLGTVQVLLHGVVEGSRIWASDEERGVVHIGRAVNGRVIVYFN